MTSDLSIQKFVNNMEPYDNLEIGDKIKIKLEQPTILCSLRERVEFYHWYVIIERTETTITLEDKKKNIVVINNEGFDENNNKYLVIKKKIS